MKKISIFLVSCITALSVFAQYNNSAGTVTITVNGNKNRQVLVDGKNYSANDNSIITNNPRASDNAPGFITIPDLPAGQHTLQLTRGNQYNNNNNRRNNSTTFSTRPGYDMQITVNDDGSVQLSETRNRNRNRNANNRYKTPMSDAGFTALLQSVKREWRTNARLTAVTNAFENTGNYFTTAQARQLIQTINPQSSRLQLAKSSYRSITDPVNFNQMNDLLTTQAARNDLQTYVSTYNNNNQGYNNNGYNNNNNDYNNNGSYNSGNSNSYRTPMADASFTTVYRNAQRQFLPGGKMSVLTDVFADANNYFTTAQAKQLILLVSDERNRLQLAKSAYRNITDPVNFNQLYDVLNSQASRNELANYVNSYNSNSNGYNNSNNGYNNPNNSYKTPMSDAAYNEILRNVQSQWLPGAKMSELTNTFANTNNYFTTAQAKQLIGLVSDEGNRLQLAKASYRGITDPANFSQVYDLLSSQVSRNELSAYVNSYARY
jgi:hypothetical protein